MPFDSTPIQEPNIFRQRREQAAALWRSVPKNRFRMSHWECGSTACALGWLAIKNHDGWRFGTEVTGAGRVPSPNGHTPATSNTEAFQRAALYFGINFINAKNCFEGSAVNIYRRQHSSDITPEDVAEMLLSLPYTYCDGSPMQFANVVEAM
jgi:hypothetical protein